MKREGGRSRREEERKAEGKREEDRKKENVSFSSSVSKAILELDVTTGHRLQYKPHSTLQWNDCLGLSVVCVSYQMAAPRLSADVVSLSPTSHL